MKLGVAYNLFDGEELLEASIRSIRDEVDYITVIYQQISNHGDKLSEKVEPLLNKLLNEKLIDSIYLYTPNLRKKAYENEVIKRNIGLKLAKKSKCTHFMTIDTDEFYDIDQFRKAKREIENNNFDGSVCHIVEYLREPIYQFEDMPDFYVPFIYKIRPFVRFKRNTKLDYKCDPTRRMKSKKLICFDKNDLVMHHMTLVRKDLKKKMSNSSISGAYSDKFYESTISWKFGNPFNDLYTGTQRTVKKVANKFNIHIENLD